MPRTSTPLALLHALPMAAALLLAGCGGGGGGPAAPACGDGQVQSGEACDGAALAGASCASLGLGFTGGVLACGPGCTFVTTGCTRPAVCGDAVAQAGEACDGADLAGRSCAGLGFSGGTLACSPGCTFVTDACTRPPVCGDGVAQAGEACDGADLAGRTCASLGLGFVGGALRCSEACTFDTAGCDRGAARCGDGIVQAGETCDDGGVVAGDGCSATCQLEAANSGWFAPGGGISEGGEP